jgi:hypothetical protein
MNVDLWTRPAAGKTAPPVVTPDCDTYRGPNPMSKRLYPCPTLCLDRDPGFGAAAALRDNARNTNA